MSSNKGPTQPWLQSIDGFNTHDEAFQLAMAGGVTSALVMTGGRNPIGELFRCRVQLKPSESVTFHAGGQAVMVKLRQTSEGSPSSMLVEPLSTQVDDSTPWRHLMSVASRYWLLHNDNVLSWFQTSLR